MSINGASTFGCSNRGGRKKSNNQRLFMRDSNLFVLVILDKPAHLTRCAPLHLTDSFLSLNMVSKAVFPFRPR